MIIMARRGSIEGVGGAAGCGRSTGSSLLVDYTCFLKTRTFSFLSFSEIQASRVRIIFSSLKLLYIWTSEEPTSGSQPPGIVRAFFCSAAVASKEEIIFEFFLPKRFPIITRILNLF